MQGAGVANVGPRMARRATAPSRSRGFRPDIEGLRAFALGGVLLFHAGVPFVSGGYVGVDVFFVISGFLIIGMLHRELAATGRIGFAAFYARRIRRLLPASAVVLVVTAIASALVLPALQKESAGTSIAAAALYVANWQFAREASDYLNPVVAPSPVEHYWSLGVEEQYYLVVPLVLALLAVVALRSRIPLRALLLAVLAAIGLASFVYSVNLTTANQSYAFFGTPARVWEFALGGCLALTVPTLARLPRVVRAMLGWAGLVVLVGSMAVLDADTPFPGTAALWPVLATGAVLVAGVGAEPAGPWAVLTHPATRHAGRISYSWYLWHWPPLVLGAAVLGHELSAWQGFAVVAVAWLPSYLSWRWIEEPFRRSKLLTDQPRSAFGLAAVLTAVGVACGLLLTAGVNTGALAVDAAGRTVEVDLAKARKDLPVVYADGCRADVSDTRAKVCRYGAASGPKVALFGDSHAAQWQPAMAELATREGWTLLVAVKTGCSPADTSVWMRERKRVYTECNQWRRSAMKALVAGPNRPDVVVVVQRDDYYVAAGSGNRPMYKKDSDGPVARGLEETYRQFADAGIPVVALGGETESGFDLPDCLSAKGGESAACRFDSHRRDNPTEPTRVAAQAVGARYVATRDLVCPQPTCYPVARGIVTFRDDHHLTATYARALAPGLGRLLAGTGVDLLREAGDADVARAG